MNLNFVRGMKKIKMARSRNWTVGEELRILDA